MYESSLSTQSAKSSQNDSDYLTGRFSMVLKPRWLRSRFQLQEQHLGSACYPKRRAASHIGHIRDLTRIQIPVQRDVVCIIRCTPAMHLERISVHSDRVSALG